MPAGRPSDYNVEMCEVAHSMAQQGATDREVAEALDIAEGTLYRWKHEHPEFSEALKLGKEAADNRVEQSLYRRAVGYSFDSIKIMQYEGDVVIEPFVEHVPPDVGAQKFWLTNRRGRDWREKREHELSGPNGGPMQLETIKRVIVDPADTHGT